MWRWPIWLSISLNPDGTFSDQDRARQRGFTWCGGQRPAGLKSTFGRRGRVGIDQELARSASFSN